MPLVADGSSSSDYFESYDESFLSALDKAKLPGDIQVDFNVSQDVSMGSASEEDEYRAPPSTQPGLKRRFVPDEEELVEKNVYGASRFGEYGEYMERKRAKLQIQNDEIANRHASGSKLFRGIAVYVNGYTQPSIQDLRQLIMHHGGIFQPYLDKKSLVTHIVTCSLTPAKLREFKNMKVVKPEWLVESARKGTLLPWADFAFDVTDRSEAAQGVAKTQKIMPVPPTSRIIGTAKLTAVSKTVTTPKSAAVVKTGLPPHYAAESSNPNAKRAMANPEWRKAHTSVAPDFIEGYYKNSRLHHLATWKAELKNLVQEAQEQAESGRREGTCYTVEADDDDTTIAAGVSMRGAEFVIRSPTKGNGKGKAKAEEMRRVIMHCDFDCFFVSAGLVQRPHLRGKPVVVCHSQGAQGGASSTSEIASSSYEARKFGIKNGMSLQQARVLCPDVATMPYEFELYKQFSLKFYTILMSHADDLEAVSVDEALIDVSTTASRLRSKLESQNISVEHINELAESIRRQVHKATGCEVSIGISHNILLARLATRRAKPAGSFHLHPEDVADFLAPLDISDLHGVGYATKQKAQEKLGTTILGELATKGKGVLCDALGKVTGVTIYNSVRGIDDRKIESDKPRKSVSCEINYGIRFELDIQAEAFIFQMAAEVMKRLNDIHMVGRSITLKVMKRDPTAPVEPPKFLGHGACLVFNKQMTLKTANGKATSDDGVIGQHAWKLLKSFNFRVGELRGLGIQIQKLEAASGYKPVPGQARIPFQRVPGMKFERLSVAPVEDEVKAEPDSGLSTDLPSFSQVDMSVFQALPPELRNELEDAYRRRSNEPFKPDRPPSPTYYPLKRITRQLVPKGRSGISPQKTNIFANTKKSSMLTLKITDADLRKKGIDPKVFNSLPKFLRSEQLTRIRLIEKFGAVPEVSGEPIIIRAPDRRTKGPIFRLPNPQGRYLPAAILRQQGKEKGTKILLTETHDIQRAIGKWVKTYRAWPPNAKDVEFFAKFLKKSVDSGLSSDVGLARGIAIMKWWLVLIRRYWGSYEVPDPFDLPSPSTAPAQQVADAWWAAFRQVKEEVDVVVRKKFGGCLLLK